MGIISYVIYGSLAMAIIGMGIGAYIENIGNGVEIVASDPFVQETVQEIQDYAIEKGSQFGKQILAEVIDKIGDKI